MTPLVRWKNFTVENLKYILNLYKEEYGKLLWKDVNLLIDSECGGYIKTSYQFAGQLGLEYKEYKKNNIFKIQNYLLEFTDEMLKKYLEFWFMLYYAPNPRVSNSNDDLPKILYVDMIKKIISKSNNRISEINTGLFNHGSADILRNCFKENAKYIFFDDNSNEYYINDNDIEAAKDIINLIEDKFNIPIDYECEETFFCRFSYENFKMFYNDKIDKFHNRIIYGAPGTGKSYIINKEVAKYFIDVKTIDRVTFYPGYTYGQFIGTYKPKPIYKDSTKIYHEGVAKPGDKHEPIISYEYVPGSLIKILVKALNSPEKKFCLIIEEINRVKVDSVFGDFFQLLDRNKFGKSEYTLKCSEDLSSYLKKVIINTKSEILINEVIYLPSNLYLWATMNSADQGVFPIDTAFKRRWNFEYVQLNSGSDLYNNYFVKLGEGEYEWNRVREFINKKLKDIVSEDRMIAPFFVKFEDFDIQQNGHYLLKRGVFINKVIMYVRDDILRHRKVPGLFYDDNVTFNDLYVYYYEGNNILKLENLYETGEDFHSESLVADGNQDYSSGK